MIIHTCYFGIGIKTELNSLLAVDFIVVNQANLSDWYFLKYQLIPENKILKADFALSNNVPENFDFQLQLASLTVYHWSPPCVCFECEIVGQPQSANYGVHIATGVSHD